MTYDGTCRHGVLVADCAWCPAEARPAPTMKELQLRLAILIGALRWVLESVPAETHPSLSKLAEAIRLWDEVAR